MSWNDTLRLNMPLICPVPPMYLWDASAWLQPHRLQNNGICASHKHNTFVRLGSHTPIWHGAKRHRKMCKVSSNLQWSQEMVPNCLVPIPAPEVQTVLPTEYPTAVAHPADCSSMLGNASKTAAQSYNLTRLWPTTQQFVCMLSQCIRKASHNQHLLTST